MALSCATPAIVGTAGATTITMSTTGGAGGTGPYTYQWYASLVTGFSAGSTNLISGATALSQSFSGLLLGGTYYFKVIVTDTGAANATATSSQSAAQLLLQTPSASPSQNVVAMSPVLGTVDLRFNSNTIEVLFDPAGSGTLVPGQAVKWSTLAGPTIPAIVPSTSAADVIAGFVNYDWRNSVYNPGDTLTISMDGNVMYLVFPAATNRGVFLFSAPANTTLGGTGFVRAVTGSSLICGYALDTVVAGGLGRVYVQTPSSPSIIG